jgi:hypothetical protein
MKSKRKINKKTKQKKLMLTRVNFSNFWFKSLDQKHHIWKNHDAQSSTNQIKKKSIIQKDPKNISIKEWGSKIKKKLVDNYKFFIK